MIRFMVEYTDISVASIGHGPLCFILAGSKEGVQKVFEAYYPANYRIEYISPPGDEGLFINGRYSRYFKNER